MFISSIIYISIYWRLLDNSHVPFCVKKINKEKWKKQQQRTNSYVGTTILSEKREIKKKDKNGNKEQLNICYYTK